MSGQLVYEKKGKVAYLTLNRPEKMNALSTELIFELAKRWAEFRDDEDVWVAVLAGAGRAFCVGADYESTKDPSFTTVPIENPAHHNIWKPVVCAINGHALGRGMGLALGCDIRIASETARFGCPEPQFGTVTRVDVFEPYLPRGIAFEMLLTGDPISARRAYEIAVVNKVVPEKDLMDEAGRMAERLCENAPLAVRGIKEMLARNRSLTPAQVDDLFEIQKNRIMNSEDREEGMRAFREKRKPQWQGK
jgi:enoyl-CoA hydratase/carnithine racemase